MHFTYTTTTGTSPEELDLRRRQQEHLASIGNMQTYEPCMHDSCPECIGTGIKKDGSLCVHMMSCTCPKCSPRC